MLLIQLSEYFFEIFIRDTSLIVVAILIVLCYMVFHLQSIFLALTGTQT